MSKKKIFIKPIQTFRSKEEEIDAWVLGKNDIKSKNLNSEKNHVEDLDEISRFTIVIPKYLHKRIKKHCAVIDKNMKEALTEILSKAFPET